MHAELPLDGHPSPSLQAFAAFYDATFDAVYRYLSRAVMGNRALAEDLTQETFASVVVAFVTARPALRPCRG